jgi:lipopolysaccharide transport system ATP-binding protein
MPQKVISVENLSKSYRLGVIGTGTFRGDLQRWWARQRGQPDPYLKIGETDHGNRLGETLWALKDINFSVQQGETLGIIGRNGAGKSTLLKILSQVTAPTSGVVKVKGRIASLLEVGTGFHPELTGRENIYLNGAILGMKKAEIARKFDEIVDFSGVEQFIDTPVKRYSSGMYVRLAFAVAAHLEPEILVVDEVLAVGDAEFQKRCLGKMSTVASEGRTVLFVSHNMAAVENLCRQAIVLDKGTVIHSGEAMKTIASYLKDMKSSHVVFGEQKRAGSGLVRINDIKIQNYQGQPLGVVQSGQDITISLHYELAPSYRNGTIHIGIGVSTQMGTKVFTHSTRLNGTSFKNVPRHGAFLFRIPHLPLPPSSYMLGCTVKVDEAYADIIPDEIELTVVEGDFYGSGKLASASSGICLIDGEWSLAPNDQPGSLKMEKSP